MVQGSASGVIGTPLEVIASEENLWRLAEELYQATRSPGLYGLRTGKEVLAKVAELRGAKPTAMVSLLNARAAAERTKLGPMDAPDVKAGPGHALAYRRVYGLDRARAQALRADLRRGRITVPRLREIAAELQAAGARPRADEDDELSGFARARDFERHVGRVLTEQGEVLFGRGSKVVPERDGAPIPVDFIIMKDGQPALAIEVRAGEGPLPRKKLFEIFGSLLAIRQKYRAVWMVSPPSWRHRTRSLQAWAIYTKVDGIKFYELPHGSNEICEIPDLSAHESLKLVNKTRPASEDH